MLSNLLGHQSKSWTFSSWTVVLHRRSISMFTKGNPRHDNYNPWGRALISSPSQLRTCFHFFFPTEICVLRVQVFRPSTNCVEEFGLHSIEKCRSKLPLAGLWSVAESFNAWRKRHITAERLKLPIAMRGHLAEHCWKWRWWGRTNNIGKRKKRDLGKRRLWWSCNRCMCLCQQTLHHAASKCFWTRGEVHLPA